MKVIYNRLIPFRGFKCINLFGILFVREGCVMTQTDYNHEAIHTAQMKEMLYIGFYLCYLVEWLIKTLIRTDGRFAYYAISYEREAYENQIYSDYLAIRKPFNQFSRIWH